MSPTNANKKAFYSLAMRYLLDEASSEERERLVVLLKIPVWQEMFNQMSAGWNASAANWLQGLDVEGEIEKVTNIIAQERTVLPIPLECTATPAKPVEHPQPRQVSRRWIGIAIAVSIAAVFALVAYPLERNRGSNNGNRANGTWTRQVNGVGERMELTLADGSAVTLNASSNLSYPSVFDARNRIVRLAGEAYFDVAHDANRPFIVETSTLRITVLGTKFNVKAFADGTKAEVTLVTGKVQITPLSSESTKPSPITLTPGMQYSITSTTGEGKILSIVPQAATSWISGKIVWNQEPLPDAMRELERRYGISIDLNDPKLLTETVTARFQSESVQEIFQLLHATGGIDYQLKENQGKIEHVILSSPGKFSDSSDKKNQ